MVDRIKHSEQNTNSDASNHNNTEEISNELNTETRTEVTPEELESIEIEVGLEEITLNSEIIDTVAAERTDTEEDFDLSDRQDNFDLNDSEIDDELSSEYAPSYGTGLKGEPTDRSGRKVHDLHSPKFHEGDSILTGGDLDANYEEADAVGDEAVGGTAATPDQDIVDNLGAAVGIEMRDRSSLRTNLILEHRDEDRWETDPESSEDYEERRED
ncbi:hypothetical protein STA3757_34290 [Stanieria sp. NIES-3757]|nr:hypothetical protein STA3757_34290 [Stanieria sp. NIES-3757]